MSYTPAFLADLDRTMTRARLSRYIAAAGGDLEQALKLYEKNVLLSEALFGFLHGLEVAVRNSLHFAFSNDLSIADWYRDGQPLPWPAPTSRTLLLTDAMRSMVADARAKAGSPATVGKLIAELPFGFWTGLISNRFDDIWRQSLYKGFPHVSVRRQVIHWRLDTIRFLRNRIAHHEPILSSANRVYTGRPQEPTISLPEMLQCVRWISPPTAEWLRTSTRYERGKALLAEFSSSGVTL